MTMAGSPIAQQEEKFRVLKRPLAEILKKMLRLEKSAKRKNAMLEVTLINGFLVLNAPGMNTKIEAHTSGSARFSISLSYFAEILKDHSFPVQTTFFEDDRILRSIQLPVNYTQADLARLIFSGKYTEEEIAFNAMKDEGMEALRVALEDFERVAKILQPYGLDKTFVMDMIQKSLVERA